MKIKIIAELKENGHTAEPVSFKSLTVTSVVFLVPAEALKEATENMARNKLQMMIKRVIKKIYDTILPKRWPENKVGNA